MVYWSQTFTRFRDSSVQISELSSPGNGIGTLSLLIKWGLSANFDSVGWVLVTNLQCLTWARQICSLWSSMIWEMRSQEKAVSIYSSLSHRSPADNAELICFAAVVDLFSLLVRAAVSFACMIESWCKFNPDRKKVLSTGPTRTIVRTLIY